MARSVNEERDFRSAEGSGFDQPTDKRVGWLKWIADIAIDTLCAIFALGINVIFAANRFFSERSEEIQLTNDRVRDRTYASSDNAMVVLGGMGLLSLAILIGLIVWSFRS